MFGLDQILGPPLRATQTIGRGASAILDKAADTATDSIPGPARRLSRDFLRGLGVLEQNRIDPGPVASDPATEAGTPSAESADQPNQDPTVEPTDHPTGRGVAVQAPEDLGADLAAAEAGSGQEARITADTRGPGLRLGHIHLVVGDLASSIDFYTDQVGFEVTERHETFSFLSGGGGHRDLVLQSVSGAERPPGGRGLGVDHVAFEVPDESALAKVAGRLSSAGTGITAIDHGISKAVYVDDPDGNRIELLCDTSAEADAWDGTSRPLDLDLLEVG